MIYDLYKHRDLEATAPLTLQVSLTHLEVWHQFVGVHEWGLSDVHHLHMLVSRVHRLEGHQPGFSGDVVTKGAAGGCVVHLWRDTSCLQGTSHNTDMI
ncbi:hypothetical protein E2C01_067303 [Portunus trituberculatus]|uniref:Uncharacterized protein n=1 Tax=Portunus trituberculatus TaxID=210409 RepID=A0A5B7HUN5_PORTR|nr:hypothetical protein [Portunus trituberculatus]